MDLQHCLSTRLSETKRWRCREMERALRNARNTTSPVTNFLPVSQTRFDSRSNSLPSPPRRRNFRQCQRNRRKWSGAREEIFGCIRPVIPTAHGLFRFVDLSSFFSNRFETEERRALALAHSFDRFQLRQIYRQLINNRRGVNCSRFCFDFPLCVQYRVERLSMTTMTMTTMMTMMITITIIIIIIRSEIVSRT